MFNYLYTIQAKDGSMFSGVVHADDMVTAVMFASFRLEQGAELITIEKGQPGKDKIQ